jgi:hypothetical protein
MGSKFGGHIFATFTGAHTFDFNLSWSLRSFSEIAAMGWIGPGPRAQSPTRTGLWALTLGPNAAQCGCLAVSLKIWTD